MQRKFWMDLVLTNDLRTSCAGITDWFSSPKTVSQYYSFSSGYFKTCSLCMIVYIMQFKAIKENDKRTRDL